MSERDNVFDSENNTKRTANDSIKTKGRTELDADLRTIVDTSEDIEVVIVSLLTQILRELKIANGP